MTVKLWLQTLNLDQYFSDFKRAGYTTIEQCSCLTEASLDDIGIALPGHRKRILAYLPKPEDYQELDARMSNPADISPIDDPIYGNVPLPPAPKPCEAKPPPDYVNAPRPVSEDGDHIYGNVALPRPEDRLVNERNNLKDATLDSSVDDTESFYDVLPPPCKVKSDVDDGEYVKIAAPVLEGAVGGYDPAPSLPPKLNRANRRSINDIIGISPQSNDVGKRPVPKPRTTVRKRSQASSSDESSPLKMENAPSPPMLKPIPKPRPKPAPRRKVHMDSDSTNSSASGSPRHSVNASPVPASTQAVSPGPSTDVAATTPKEAATTTAAAAIVTTPNSTVSVSPEPIAQEMESVFEEESPVGTAAKSETPTSRNEQDTKAATAEAATPDREDRPPPLKPRLSMETEVPPARPRVPCDIAEIKIPLPPSRPECEENNNTSEEINKIHTYDNAPLEKRYQDPDNPEKLEDFIKSLLPHSSAPQPSVVPAEAVEVQKEAVKEAEMEDVYQVMVSGVFK